MPETMHRVPLAERNQTLKLCCIFSSNDNCNLDVVEKLLSCIKEKLGIKMLACKNHFSLSDTTEMCESIIPDLPMDFAIFVVHANEDRFLINEDSGRIYRTLLNATGRSNLVLVCRLCVKQQAQYSVDLASYKPPSVNFSTGRSRSITM